MVWFNIIFFFFFFFFFLEYTFLYVNGNLFAQSYKILSIPI